MRKKDRIAISMIDLIAIQPYKAYPCMTDESSEEEFIAEE